MLTDRDLPTLHAAASALRHAPASMRAAHLAERLEEMARRARDTRDKERGDDAKRDT